MPEEIIFNLWDQPSKFYLILSGEGMNILNNIQDILNSDITE